MMSRLWQGSLFVEMVFEQGADTTSSLRLVFTLLTLTMSNADLSCVSPEQPRFTA